MPDPTPVEPDVTPVITLEQGNKLATEIKDDFLPAVIVYITAAALASSTRTGYVDAQKAADTAMNELLAKQEAERTALSKSNAEAVMLERDKWATAEAERKAAEAKFIKEANYVSALAGGDPNAIDPTPTIDPVPPTPIDPPAPPIDPPMPMPTVDPVPVMAVFKGGSK